LANEKTPLRDTAPSTPQRANKTADRSTVARRRVIVGVVIAVVVIGALFFILSKDNPITSIIPGVESSPVPEFAFNHKHVTSGFEATVAKVNKDKQQHAAKQVTPAVQAAVTQLLQTGYVDPDTWGDAGAIDDLFTGTAKDQVEPNVDTLTLGTAAADTYESFDPSNANRLKVVAMTDGNAAAIRSMATFEFTGKANQSDGTVAKVTVTGTLFFVPEGNDWRIEAFSVQREIKPMTPKSSATSATASSSEAP
jgi:hypothetical protein